MFAAMAFFDTFEERQDQNYAEYLEKLTTIRKKEHMETDPLVGVLRYALTNSQCCLLSIYRRVIRIGGL